MEDKNIKKLSHNPKLLRPYYFHLAIMLYILVFGFFVSDLQEIIWGMQKIVYSRDILITDYVALVGLGPTLINVALSGLIIMWLFYYENLRLNGALIMSIWLIMGFSFLGKNVVNMLPILTGGYLYAYYKKEPFSRYSLVTVLSTTLSPVVSEMAFYFIKFGTIPATLAFIFSGISIGFVMAPISVNAMKSHAGFNLYNVGFAGGIIGAFYLGLMSFFGYEVTSQLIWLETTDMRLLFMLFSIFITMIVYGFINSSDIKKHYKAILNSRGRLISDYYIRHDKVAYINMGVVGLIGIAVTLLIGAPINGATSTALFTIAGFGCFGKHPRNIIPVMLGAILTVIVSAYSLNSPSMILGILFSTALAPISGTYGFLYGLLAGSVHIIIVSKVISLHGGLNLYNNGLAAGITAMILIPVITAFRKEDIK